MTEETQNTPGQEEREFEDLSLSEMIGDLLRQPFATVRRLAVVTNPARQPRPIRVRRPAQSASDAAPAGLSINGDGLRLSLLLMAFLMAMFGNFAVFQPLFNQYTGVQRMSLLIDVAPKNAFVWWGLAIILTIVALRFVNVNRFDYEDEYHSAISDEVGFRWWALIGAVPLLLLAFVSSSNNEFTVVGVVSWLSGIAAVSWAFTPAGVDPLRALNRAVMGVVQLPRTNFPVALALVLILLLAAYARFNGLGDVPAEMTSDHIEKILDAQRVLEGDRDIFFANNQGREPIQMYFIAALTRISGSDSVTFDHLKMAAAIESLLGVMALFVFGRVAVGERDRRLGTLLGIALALFAAVGYWHLIVTRVSLRIMLTPLMTTIFLIFLMRLIRHNRREDAVMLGLSLGVGLYSYQALRMLPIVAVVVALYIAVFVARNMRERGAAVFNLFVIAIVSFAVFVPLFRYSTEHPEEFWRRAQGRLLGEDMITEQLDDGRIVNRSPTLIERGAAFMENVPLLGENMVHALGMFTYRSDGAWLHNAPSYPVFDPVMGAFLIVGVVSWLLWAVQKREYPALFLLVVLLLMLVPSVVAIANTGENPSNTRASGAMPVAYLFAAFGIVRLIIAIGRVVPSVSALITVLVLGITAFNSLGWANRNIFGPYDDFYQNSWSPQREAGYFMRGVAESDGAWGNVFILASPHFFDYRGVAMEAGVKPGDFRNGDIQLQNLPAHLLNGLVTQGQFHLDPDRYIVIIYSLDDAAASTALKSWFPEGLEMVVDTRQDKPWLVNEAYRAFRIPPPGINRLVDFFESQGISLPPIG